MLDGPPELAKPAPTLLVVTERIDLALTRSCDGAGPPVPHVHRAIPRGDALVFEATPDRLPSLYAWLEARRSARTRANG